MNAWSKRRKRIILSMIFGTLFVLVGLPLFFFFYHGPTCSDSKQNGDETGIDCGGGCEKLCQAQNLPILLKGDPQIVQVGSTTYALVMHAENPNINADILNAQYTFKTYEASSSVPVKIIDGTTYVPKNSEFAIFFGPLDFNEAKPSRAVFEWKDKSLVWNKNTKADPSLTVDKKMLINEDIEPKVTAEIRNPSLEKVENIELTALLSDINGNVVGASKTFVDSIDKEGVEEIIFTWPAPFQTKPTSIDILIKILPDKSFL